jgi:hypothetical protein
VGGKGGSGGRAEKWPKPCMHIWMIKQQQQKKRMNIEFSNLLNSHKMRMKGERRKMEGMDRTIQDTVYTYMEMS